MKTLADKIIDFNTSLRFGDPLPAGIQILNPFLDNAGALEASSLFYKKYYNDNEPRHVILGINPGRFGAGLTGVPFTDPKRLVDACGIGGYAGPVTHEPSSVFVYEMIEQYGGAEKFYQRFYINSICPLGFTNIGGRGKELNYNYYDSKDLTLAVQGFIVESIQKQLTFGIVKDVCFCLGTGKNEKFLTKWNAEHGWFDRVVALEHPRYIIQYKSKRKQYYIDKYLENFANL